jgi:hypothetical protein
VKVCKETLQGVKRIRTLIGSSCGNNARSAQRLKFKVPKLRRRSASRDLVVSLVGEC